MGRDMLRRTRLGVLAGVGGLALAACAPAGAVSGAQPPRSPSVSATPGAGSATPAITPSATGSTPTPTPSASIGKSEGTLQVLTFQGDVEYGGTSSRVNWVTPFETKSGCRVVKLDRVRTSEEMAAKLRGGTYDVVSPAPDLAGQLVTEGRVAPIDTSLVQDYRQIPKRLRELPALQRDHKVYGIPYLWGVNQTIYEGGGRKGPEALYGASPAAIRDTPLSIADAALVLRRTEPGLGIEDPFQLTPSSSTPR
ncbi:hypothetical protein ACFQX6_29255 [Streptosporangium lutulentum]